MNINSSSLGLPEVIFIETLSALTGKKLTTIRTCATNEKYFHLIPRPFKQPNSRRLCWYLGDVMAWLDLSSQVNPHGRKKIGRPTKREAERALNINNIRI